MRSYPIVYPEFKATNFTLRCPHMDDAQQIFLLRSDLSVNKYIDRPIATSIDDAKAFLERILNGIRTQQWFYWSLVPQDHTAPVGTICLYNIDEDLNSAEIGYELLPAWQGRGLITTAIPVIIGFAKSVGIKLLNAELHKDNQASLKLLDKYGFIKEKEGPDDIVTYNLQLT